METISRGHRIHYEVRGEGEPLLLVHGHLQAGEDWLDYAYPELLDGFRCVIPDLLGFGSSDKPHDAAHYSLTGRVGDLVAVLDAEGIERAHIWGYSFGCTVAEAFARLQPVRAGALVLGGSLPGLKGIDRQNIYAWQVPIYEANDWTRIWAEVYSDMPSEVRARFQPRNDLLACAASWAGSFEALPAEDAPIPTPLLCYVGTDEWFWEGSRDVTEAAGGQFVPIDGADHGAAFQRATDAVAAVRPFLEAS